MEHTQLTPSEGALLFNNLHFSKFKSYSGMGENKVVLQMPNASIF